MAKTSKRPPLASRARSVADEAAPKVRKTLEEIGEKAAKTYRQAEEAVGPHFREALDRARDAAEPAIKRAEKTLGPTVRGAYSRVHDAAAPVARDAVGAAQRTVEDIRERWIGTGPSGRGDAASSEPSAPAAGSATGTTRAPDLSSATKQELYERAKQLDIEGRSKMSKDELAKAIRDVT